MQNFQVDDDLLLQASMKYKKQNLTEAHQYSAQDIEYKDNNAIDFQITSEYKVNSKQSYYLSPS